MNRNPDVILTLKEYKELSSGYDKSIELEEELNKTLITFEEYKNQHRKVITRLNDAINSQELIDHWARWIGGTPRIHNEHTLKLPPSINKDIIEAIRTYYADIHSTIIYLHNLTQQSENKYELHETDTSTEERTTN